MTKPETRKVPITLGPEKSLKGFRREEVKLQPKEFVVKEPIIGKRTSGKRSSWEMIVGERTIGASFSRSLRLTEFLEDCNWIYLRSGLRSSRR